MAPTSLDTTGWEKLPCRGQEAPQRALTGVSREAAALSTAMLVQALGARWVSTGCMDEIGGAKSDGWSGSANTTS